MLSLSQYAEGYGGGCIPVYTVHVHVYTGCVPYSGETENVYVHVPVVLALSTSSPSSPLETIDCICSKGWLARALSIALCCTGGVGSCNHYTHTM